MQVCRRNFRQGSRLPAGIARRRRPLRCGWCGRCAQSWAPITGRWQRVARQLGYGVEVGALRARQADIDDGYAPGVSTAESARIRDLEQEVRELKRANVIFSRCRGLRRDQGVCVVDNVFDVPSRVVRS